MTFRTMLLTAAMLVPLAFDATPAAAQDQGTDGAAPVVQARYSDPESIPFGHRPAPGMCRVWVPGVAPGQQTPPVPCETPTPESAPEPEPEPQPEPEPCVTTFTTVNGVPGFLDCNGVFTPAFPG